MGYEFRYPQAAQVLYAALAGDAFYRTLESAAAGSRVAAQAAMLRYLDYSMVEADEYGLLCFAREEGLGAALWNRPLDPATRQAVAEQKAAFLELEMGTWCREVHAAMTGFMHAHTTPLVPPESWYLSIIGIAPEEQGKGHGERLMNSVLQQTDAAGICTYLETFTARNKPFYQRLGYEQLALFHEPATDADYAVFLRCPPGRAPR